MTLKATVTALIAAAAAATATADVPPWFETDSATAIHARLLSDFSLTMDQARRQINDRYGLDLDSAAMRSLADRRLIETRMIDSQERVHRKSPRNLGLLDPALNGGWQRRGHDAPASRIAYADSVLAWIDGTNPLGGAHSVTYRFTIDVPPSPLYRGDTLRVWMPVPMATDRQSDIEILSATPAGSIVTPAGASVHNTIYFERAASTTDTLHFEYTASYTVRGTYFDPADIKARMKPYDKESGLYREYTAMERPHIVDLKPLALAIVGDADNPLDQSERVYDFIVNHYPWAGAREYSTIGCIPTYVVAEGHGDCGQVALLYISLMRSLGVPARWESGWMLHPGEKNLHDWAEVYFEGIGWVPVDPSFGRYDGAADSRTRRFYSTGIDAHRLAANKGVGGTLYPPKRHLRSETVDSQLGEVETTRANLFYPAWSQHLQIIDIHPIKTTK